MQSKFLPYLWKICANLWRLSSLWTLWWRSDLGHFGFISFSSYWNSNFSFLGHAIILMHCKLHAINSCRTTLLASFMIWILRFIIQIQCMVCLQVSNMLLVICLRVFRLLMSFSSRCHFFLYFLFHAKFVFHCENDKKKDNTSWSQHCNLCFII